MDDESKMAFVRLGKAQVDAMFDRQKEGPAIDDSDFVPLVEAVVTAFKTVQDDTVLEDVWEYAYAVYDRLCREADPTSTAAENRELMQSFLLDKRRKQRRRP